MAGEVQIALKRSLTAGGVTIGGASETIQDANYQLGFQETIPANTTDHQINMVITVANSKIQALEATVDMTVCTNAASGGSPAQTIALKANSPIIWTENEPSGTKPLTTNVTALYVTNAGSTAGTFRVIVAADQTP